MAYTRAWNEATPPTAENIALGAQRIREGEVDVRERIDTLITDGTTPVPPATITDTDRRIATNTDPMWVRGDRVDIRGCTWRSPAPVTSGDATLVTGTSWKDIAGVTMTFTPVSPKSLLMFTFQGLFHFIDTSSDFIADASRRGEIRITRVNPGDPANTAGTPMSPLVLIPRLPYGNANAVLPICLRTRLTVISTSQEYRVQIRCANAAAALTFKPRGDLEPLYFMVEEYV